MQGQMGPKLLTSLTVRATALRDTRLFDTYPPGQNTEEQYRELKG